MVVSTGKTHTDSKFEKELSELRTTIQEMGCRVEDMCAESIQSLVHSEPELAREVIERDAVVNRLNLRVDEVVHQMLSLRQPMGKDLRFITTGLKIASDLERVGDLSVNLAERVLDLSQEPPLKAYVALPQMAGTARSMLTDSLESFLQEDPALAQKVIESDDFVDDLNEQLFRELLSYMIEDPKYIGRATRLTFISKYIERIADHASDIGKSVIFMVKGTLHHRSGN